MDRADIAEILRRHDGGESWAAIAPTMGYGSGEHLRSYIKRRPEYAERRRDAQKNTQEPPPSAEPEGDGPLIHPVTGKPVEHKGDIIFEDRRPQPTDADVETLWGAYLGVMKAARPFKTAQRFANITIKGALPIGIVNFGDQHVGAWSQAAERMLEDYKLVAQTEGLYVNLLGDEIDNFIFNFARWASVMPPDHQRRITEWLMKLLKDRVLSLVLGNHIHWSKKAADFDWSERLAWLEDAVYLGHRGNINLKVGSQSYNVHLCHRAVGVSSINKSNSGRRTADDIGGADVIVEAHRHDPWLHQEYKGGKRQIWTRCGTYKLGDDFADEYGFPASHWDMPLVILLPDQKRGIPHLDFRDGLSHLAALRAQYGARQQAVAK